MKPCVRWLAAFTLITGVLSPVSLYAAAAGTGWYNNYEEAVAAARREGKPIFADFSTSWCGMCKQLDAKTFTDPGIMARLDNFVKVKVDAEQRPDLAKQFSVAAYPTLVSIDPSGRVVDKSEGFYAPREFGPKLDGIMQAVAASTPPPAAAPEPPRSPGAGAMTNVRQISQPVLENGSEESRPNGRRPVPQLKADGDALEVSVDNDSLPVSKPGGKQTAKAAKAPMSLSASTSAAARKKLTEQTEAKPAARSEKAKVVADVATPRIKLPLGGGALNSEAAGEQAMQLAQAAPAENPTPAAEPAADDPAASDELPRPMLRAGSVRNAVEAKAAATPKASATPKAAAATPKSSATTKDAAAAKPAARTAEKTPESKAAKPAADTKSSKRDPLATIRKLQGTGSKTADAALAADKATTATETASGDKKKTPDTETPAPAENTPKPATAAKSSGGTTSTATTETAEPSPAPAVAAGESSADTPAAPTVEDIQRWMKDADSKLVAGRKKEARAMYAKVVEQDSENTHGRTDMAFIKMVSLMVDQDDDALRRKALNKIKEFESRFPDSPHKDYYTLIRATLAADLGETNAAHALLESYSERFPDSKYQKLAHATWKDLPPVTKPAAGSATPKSGTAKKTPAKASE